MKRSDESIDKAGNFFALFHQCCNMYRIQQLQISGELELSLQLE